MNLGLRYDRYRVFLPEQERPASRFSVEARSFAAVDDVKTFNHLAPRIGLVFDLAGNGRTLLKANYGRYYFNPGVTLADSVNPNTSTQYTQYGWTDRNGDRLWQDGEQGAISSSSAAPPASRSIRTCATPTPTSGRPGSSATWAPGSARVPASYGRWTATATSSSTGTGRSRPTTSRSRWSIPARTAPAARATIATST